MKRIIFAASFLAVVTATFADNGNSGWTPSVTLRSVVASKYLAGGNGGLLYDKPTLQSDVFVNFKNGFYVDLWNAAPFEGYNHNFGTEQDLGVGWCGPLSTFGLTGQVSEITLDIGTWYFDEPGLLTIGSKDILYTEAKLSKAFQWLTVYALFEHYIAMPNSPYHGGNLFSGGASKGVALFNNRLIASTWLSLTYDDGGFGHDHGLFLRGSVELDWKLAKHLTLVLPQVKYFAPLTVHDSRSADKAVFGGFGWQF